MNRKIILIIAAMLPGIWGLAQDFSEPLSLNLQEAVDYALQNNKSLMNARMDVEKSEEGIWEAISQGLPQVDASIDYLTYFNYELQFQFGTAEDFNFTQDQLTEASMKTMSEFSGIPALGIQGVTAQDIYNHNAGSYYDGVLQSMMPATTILMSDQMTAKLQVSQLVFSGQYIVGIQTAKLAKQITEIALANSEVGTKEAVINSYYLCLISKKSLEFIENSLIDMKEILRQTEKMAETGMAEELDSDQFRVTVNQLENTKKSMERGLELNYNMLRFSLGLPAGTEITLTDNLDILFDEMKAVDLLMNEFNVEENITYQILKSQEEINKKLWNLQKWNYGPTIAGFYNYNQKILTTGFDMTPNHLAGFSVQLPIFSSGSRKAKMDQAKIDYEKSSREKEILADQLEIQNRQLKFNLENSIENYNTQKENVDVANSVVENYQRKYHMGMASSLEVTQANSSYMEAESNFLSAMFEVMNARIALEKLLNNLNSL